MTLRSASLRLLHLGCLAGAVLALPVAAVAADDAARKPAKPRAKAAQPAPASSIRLPRFGGAGAPSAMPGSALSLPGSLAASDAGEDYIVAVVDNGVDPGHPAIGGTVSDGRDKIVQLFDFGLMVDNHNATNTGVSPDHGMCCASAITVLPAASTILPLTWPPTMKPGTTAAAPPLMSAALLS